MPKAKDFWTRVLRNHLRNSLQTSGTFPQPLSYDLSDLRDELQESALQKHPRRYFCSWNQGHHLSASLHLKSYAWFGLASSHPKHQRLVRTGPPLLSPMAITNSVLFSETSSAWITLLLLNSPSKPSQSLKIKLQLCLHKVIPRPFSAQGCPFPSDNWSFIYHCLLLSVPNHT